MSLKPRDLLPYACTEIIGKSREPRVVAVGLVPDHVEGPLEAHLSAENALQIGGRWQGKVMHHTDAAPLAQQVQLHGEVLPIPFYELHSRIGELEPDQNYMLYCDQCVMSRLHAGNLAAAGFDKVKVYRPQS